MPPKSAEVLCGLQDVVVEVLVECRQIQRDEVKSQEHGCGSIGSNVVEKVKPAESNKKQSAAINAENTKIKMKEVSFEVRNGTGDDGCDRKTKTKSENDRRRIMSHRFNQRVVLWRISTLHRGLPVVLCWRPDRHVKIIEI